MFSRYWRTPSGSEVDFVWSRGVRRVAIEVKGARRWRSDDAAVLSDLLAAERVSRAFGVYTGRESVKQGGVAILPLGDFLTRLRTGRVIG